MRILLALASCVVLAGCSSSDSREPTEASSHAAAGSVDSCDLLTESQVQKLARGSVGTATPGLTGGLPNCQWAVADGGFVQAIGASSPKWAQSLPENVRAIEASGLVTDEKNMKKLRDGAALVAAGRHLSPNKACALFSDLLELQGQPSGTPRIVTVVPTREDPKAVTGQWCSGGRFTSVLVGNQAGLKEPLPVELVLQALKAAHRKNLR